MEWALPILAHGRSVYAPDLPGFGGNGPANDASSERSAAFVAAFADALGLGRAAVAGNSFGGLVALRLALSEPARVSACACSRAQADLGKTVYRSLQVWLDTHPATKRSAFAVLGAAVLLAARAALRN